MVTPPDKWKIDPNCKVEEEELPQNFNEVEKIIKEKGKEFTEESYQWVETGVLSEEEFVNEREARNNLLNSILSYAKVCRRFTGTKENNYLLIDEVWKKIRDELNTAVNQVFSPVISGKKLKKRKGESMEHYLMRCAILVYLDRKCGVKEFQEEYSKLKEVFENFMRGVAGENEWEKVAKRADLYVILNNGSRLWIEVERATSSSEFSEKLKRLRTVLSHSPNLFDKVVFVFPSLIAPMAESELAEARKIGFPEEKLEFYEVNLRENKIIHLVDPKLVDLEFGDRILDMIADGFVEPRKKTAKMYRERVEKEIIIPLVRREWSEEYVISKKEKIRRLIRFWRKHTRKHFSPEEKVEFKEHALKKIKQNYPFLLK